MVNCTHAHISDVALFVPFKSIPIVISAYISLRGFPYLFFAPLKAYLS